MVVMSAPANTSVVSKPEISLVQLYLLRVAYLLLVVGLGSAVWPALFHHESWPLTLSPWNGIGTSMLCALSLLALLGIRKPLAMLPLLVFETTWKVIWLTAVALPLWTSHTHIDDVVVQTIQACLMVVIFPLVIPWRYVFANFVAGPADRWR